MFPEYFDNLKTLLNYLTDARDYLATYMTDIYKVMFPECSLNVPRMFPQYSDSL